MVMDITCVPRVFTKIMKEAIKWARKMGVRCIFYLNNILILGSRPSKCSYAKKIVLNILLNLVFTINFKKSDLIPKMRIEFLGFVIDSQKMTFEASKSKLNRVNKAIKKLIRNPKCTIRHLATVIGKIVALSLAILPAKLNCRTILRDKN